MKTRLNACRVWHRLTCALRLFQMIAPARASVLREMQVRRSLYNGPKEHLQLVHVHGIYNNRNRHVLTVHKCRPIGQCDQRTFYKVLGETQPRHT